MPETKSTAETIIGLCGEISAAWVDINQAQIDFNDRMEIALRRLNVAQSKLAAIADLADQAQKNIAARSSPPQ